MRILHTSDWHLGKSLEGVSRIDEQEKFCNDFVELVEKNDVDLVLIAGDIYDTFNPPAAAESLFYNTIDRLSDNGRRSIFIIAGNHDNPERLESITPLVDNRGVTILGYPLSSTNTGIFEGFEKVDTEDGFTKIKIKDEVINIISLPYPSEKRLNDVIKNFEDESEMQKSYSKKIGELFSKLEENYKEDEINIAVSHIFVVGSEITDSERRIELGGSLLVEKKDLPKKSQYTALGHIHKPQRISKKFNAYYSGSPIQYSKNERNTAKSVYIVDLEAGKEADVRQECLNNYREINMFRCSSVEEAIAICESKKDDDMFAYFEIETDEAINAEDIKIMKKLMRNILEIKPIIKNAGYDEVEEILDINKSNIDTYFEDFYKTQNEGLEVSKDVFNLFKKLINDEEVHTNEAD
ncbi:metallophosphoesterase family protein [Peptostreptococcus faecalis]|uniref:metallophosphoesterase family protein n=1 Tax=Peptostreptococcus faecalis TaxID=2045015 RepID=UPI000C7BD5B7|nr:exonuclease subunit SbcD [Peptostreptococcus faecalis]